MNKLIQARSSTLPLAVRIAHSIPFRGEPLAEKISMHCESRSEAKSQRGRHAKSILLLEKAQKFSASAARKSDLGEKVTSELVRLAQACETEAARLRKSFVPPSLEMKGDFAYYRSPVQVPEGIDINELADRLDGMGPRLEEARNWFTAADCRAKAAGRYEKKGEIGGALSQLEKANSDYHFGLTICSNLRLPKSLLVFETVPLAGEASKKVGFGQARSDSAAAMEKLRALSGTLVSSL